MNNDRLDITFFSDAVLFHLSGYVDLQNWECRVQKIFIILKKRHYIHKKLEFGVTLLEDDYLGIFFSRSQL